MADAARAPTPCVFAVRLGRGAPARPHPHGHTRTVVAARAPAGQRLPWRSAGAMGTPTGEWSSRAPRAPPLRPGQVVVRDTVSAHTAASRRPALAAWGGARLFLPPSSPPSSPDFLPSEQAGSQRKAIRRGVGARTREAGAEAARLASDALTHADTAAWFAHAGYLLPAQGN